MQEENVEKVQYLEYNQLTSPEGQKIAQTSIDLGFASSQWFIQFQTLTHLRQANRFYASVFTNQLLPLYYKHILLQIDNLRSNNSKEALTLVAQIFQHQKMQSIDHLIVRALVGGMITKSICEKAFLKNQALRGLNHITQKWNDGALQELCYQTQSNNGHISQLAIKLLSQMVKNNKNYESDDKFLKNLSHNLNGKRAVLQKRAKQILLNLKQREGAQKLQKKINSSQELIEEESNTLRRELKQKQQKSKGPSSFRQFMKQKKQES